MTPVTFNSPCVAHASQAIGRIVANAVIGVDRGIARTRQTRQPPFIVVAIAGFRHERR
jgi:hypothetical protein